MRQKRRVGDFLRIVTDDSTYFGRVLEEPFVAFYAPASSEQSLPDSKAEPVVDFTVAVMNHAVSSGRWKVIGNAPLPPALQRPIRTFRQDIVSGQLYIMEGHDERKAAYDECLGLERSAVWDPEHVEDRLRDSAHGVENNWEASLRFKPM